MGYAKEWLTKEEWNKLKNAPTKKEYDKNPEKQKWRDELLLRVTYKAGLRISEALSLQHPYNFKLDDDNGYVQLNPEVETHKTENELQPCGTETVRDVYNFMSAFHGETNFVFEISRQRAYQIVNELADEVGIDKKLGTHTLRRSRANHLLNAGWHIEDVSDFLRHDRLENTKKYLKISKNVLAEKMKETDDELGL